MSIGGVLCMVTARKDGHFLSILKQNIMYKTIQVVMLPSNEKANIRFDGNNKLIYHQKELLGDKSQHLYFLNDEPIKEGDWCYDEYNKVVFQNNSKGTPGASKKIICTTDSSIACVKDVLSIPQRKGLTNHYPTEKWILPQPPQDFINYYVEQYNLGNVITEVEVEYEYNPGNRKESEGSNHIEKYCMELKLNKNEITIKPIKDSYSREEVKKLLWKLANGIVSGAIKANDKDTDKWISKNL